MSRVQVTIDQLVLRGFEAGSRNAVADSLQTELARVLADQAARGDWARSHRTPVPRPAAITAEPGPAGGRTVGRGVARMIGMAVRP